MLIVLLPHSYYKQIFRSHRRHTVLFKLSKMIEATLRNAFFRKMSEEEINFDSFMNFPFFWFRMLKFDFKLKPTSLNTSLNEKLAYYTRKVFVRLTLVCAAISTSSFTAFIFANSDDFLSNCIESNP